MLHYGKTPEGELDIRADGKDVGVLYRAISAADLPERGTLHKLKTYLEDNFEDDIKERPAMDSLNI